MQALLERSSLAETVVDAVALLEGAAEALSLKRRSCKRLSSLLGDAVTAASDPALYQPQRNKFTVFAETWHAATLAQLNDADLADAWRLADYLLLDPACFKCLEDVVLQRLLLTRTDADSDSECSAVLEVLSPDQRAAVDQRADRVLCLLPEDVDGRACATGRAQPMTRWQVRAACLWGTLARTSASAASVKNIRDDYTYSMRGTTCVSKAWVTEAADYAVQGGQLGLLQWLSNNGLHCECTALSVAISFGHDAVAEWLAENSPSYASFATEAATWSNLTLLKLAHAKEVGGRRRWGMSPFDAAGIERLRRHAKEGPWESALDRAGVTRAELDARRPAVLAWLDALPSDSEAGGTAWDTWSLEH